MPHYSTAVVHADESCLGNGLEGRNPGGAASLIEVMSQDTVLRWDIFISAPDTTNNRMALAGAIATFALLSQRFDDLRVIYVSDSQYLVKGMTEWMPGWRARGWRRKGGKVENLALWKRLTHLTEPYETTWKWIRGHAGHAKNEYANDLAMRAAAEQMTSDGMVASSFGEWLQRAQANRQFVDYDADAALAELQAEVRSTS